MKKTRKYRFVLTLAVGLLVLLPLLAVLQYHWLAQLSRSETVRMQTNLDAALRHVSADIRREVFQATRTFFLRSVDNRAGAGSELGLRFEQWQSVAPYPSLLKAVYWVDMAETDAGTQLSRLIPERRTLEPISWPNELLRWRQPFFMNADSASAAARQATYSDAAPLVFQVPVFDTSEMQPAEMRRERPTQEPSRIQHTILLVFDQEVITEIILPALVQTYLGHDEQLDYDILLVELNARNTILYRSSPDLMIADFEHPDAMAYLGLLGRRGFGQDLDSLDTWFATFGGQRGFSGRNPRNAEERPPGRMSNLGNRPTPDQPIPFQQWQLLARHKDGSLEQVVMQARLRNLAVSFGVLLLLGGAVMLILFYTRQMQQLADQQMAFVAGVSHELRTPIAVMHSAGENLQDGLIEDREETKDYGTMIVRESRRLLDMVEQVLAFSGISSRQQPFVNEPVNMAHLLEKALDLVRPVLIEKGFTLDTQIATDLPAVRGDEAALVSAVQNLLHNAIKYGERSGWIGLEVRRVVTGQNVEVLLTVQDKGEGIATGEQERIFEPFYRTPTAVKAGIKGNGLGLSIVKNIIEAHGGRVEVESVPHEGSRFTIRLKAMTTAHKSISEPSLAI